MERNGVFRTLHPDGRPSNMLPGCNEVKVQDRSYLERMINHEERKEARLNEELGFLIWRYGELGRMRQRLEAREDLKSIKMVREKLRFVAAKKAIWNVFMNELD